MPSLYNVHTVPFYWGSAAEQSVNFFVPYASSSFCTSVHRAALYRYWWIFVILKNPLILRESWDCVIPVNPSLSCIMWFFFNFIKHNLLKDKRTYRATGKSLVFFIYTRKFSMHFSDPSFCGAYLCDDFFLSQCFLVAGWVHHKLSSFSCPPAPPNLISASSLSYPSPNHLYIPLTLPPSSPPPPSKGRVVSAHHNTFSFFSLRYQKMRLFVCL